MPSKEEMQAELDVLAIQKQEILEDFGKKYAELEAEVTRLSEKKAELLGYINDADNVKEESKNILSKAVKNADEILKAADQKAAEIVDKATEQANALVELANQMNAEAETLRKDAVLLDEQVGKAKNDADLVLREAKNLKGAAIELMDEAEKREENAKTRDLRSQDIAVELENRRAELEARLEAASLMEKAVSIKDASLSELIIDTQDKKAALDRAWAGFEVKDAELDDERKAFLAEKERAISDMKKISEDNAWRSRELDLGFEKLKNDRDVLNRDMKKLELMKKELSK